MVQGGIIGFEFARVGDREDKGRGEYRFSSLVK
jgi:hypothetical protein